MKVSLTFLFIFIGLLFAPQTWALSQSTTTLTPALTSKLTPTPTVNTSLLDKINNLKEKIASEVANMHLVEKRGFLGTVTATTDSQITINDLQDNVHIIDVDQITKFSDASGKTIGISDLIKGTRISALGLYNKDSRHLLARFVSEITLPTYLTGQILSVNRIKGTFFIQDESNKQHNIDVESFTKTYSFAKGGTGLVKSGFSKLDIGNRVFIIGYPDKNDATLLVASRIIWLTDAPTDPKIQSNVAPTSATSSSGLVSPTSTKTNATTK